VNTSSSTNGPRPLGPEPMIRLDLTVDDALIARP
jgi:hypothetical protein